MIKKPPSHHFVGDELATLIPVTDAVGAFVDAPTMVLAPSSPDTKSPKNEPWSELEPFVEVVLETIFELLALDTEAVGTG